MRSFFGLLQVVWTELLMCACGVVVFILSFTWWSIPLALAPFIASFLPSAFRTDVRRPQHLQKVRLGMVVAWFVCVVLTALASLPLAGISLLASVAVAGISWFLESSEVANSYLL